MSTEPAPNLELLRRVLRYIDAHPEEWDQTTYAVLRPCGTCCCVAGHTCILSGVQIEWGRFSGSHVAWTMNHGHIGEAARKLLGITGDESVELFAAHNTRADLERYASQIAARAGQPLWPEEEAN